MSKRVFIVFTFILSSILAYAQNAQEFFIVVSTPSPINDTIYIAGSFNNWNPKLFALKKRTDGKFEITLKLRPGNYEYKLTRGSWDKAECNLDGSDLDNRDLIFTEVVSTKKEIYAHVKAWKDQFKNKPKVSTASPQVKIVDTAFYMPQLNKHRRIWIYLPKDYATTTKKYAVLYMHDGQNLFEDTTSYSGEWGVDEWIDSLSQKLTACIVVGIDNGADKRMNEYNVYDTKQFGKGEGKPYIDFIVNTLKPYIDKHFRTLKDKKHTAIAGSSMGGLISFSALIAYPNVFGTAGIFSPAFWIAKPLDSVLTTKAKAINSKLFFYMGNEGKEMDDDMQRVIDKMKKLSNSKIVEFHDPQSKHNEKAWRKWFDDFYLWMMQ